MLRPSQAKIDEILRTIDRDKLLDDSTKAYSYFIRLQIVVHRLLLDDEVDKAYDLADAGSKAFMFHCFQTAISLIATDPKIGITKNQLPRFVTYLEGFTDSYDKYKDRTKEMVKVFVEEFEETLNARNKN